VTTREDVSTAASRADAAARPLGDQIIALLDVSRLRAATHAGRRVEVRGLLDRTTADLRLDVL
jgi:hypothetical protein